MYWISKATIFLKVGM